MSKYIVKKTDKEDEFEFTHLEEKETLSGEKIEVIKGKNILTVEKLEETKKTFQKEIDENLSEQELKRVIDNLKQERKEEIQARKEHIKKIDEFIEAINQSK
jgi:hypothetical protein